MRKAVLMVTCVVMLGTGVAGAQDVQKARPYHRCEIYDCPYVEGYHPDPDELDAPLRTVRITFSNVIRGHRVSVVWNPARADRSLVGPATITFVDAASGRKHIYVTNYFSMPSMLFPDSASDQDGKIASWMDGKKFVFAYPLRYPALGGKPEPMSTDQPFFMRDVDWDGNQELVIVCAGLGQRGGDVYHAYEMRCHSKHTMVDYHDKIDGEAACFDSMTEFNKKARTMKRIYSGGAFNSDEVLYKWVEATSTTEGGMRELLPVRLGDSGTDSTGKYRHDRYIFTRKKTKVVPKPGE